MLVDKKGSWFKVLGVKYDIKDGRTSSGGGRHQGGGRILLELDNV